MNLSDKFFLCTFIAVSVASDAVNWTTSPKDSEHFVGSDAILRWEYSTHPSNKIRFIKFGIKVRANESVTDVVIIRKDVLTRVVTFNKKSDREVTAPFDGRVSVLKNETASFKIRKLTMSDSGTYFCYLEPEDRIDGMPGNDEVKIKVVGECSSFFHLCNYVAMFNWKGNYISRADSHWLRADKHLFSSCIYASCCCLFVFRDVILRWFCKLVETSRCSNGGCVRNGGIFVTFSIKEFLSRQLLSMLSLLSLGTFS